MLATARVAGIMAAKRTSDLIPLCHQPALPESTSISPSAADIEITATVRRSTDRMGARWLLTAVSVAALTLYDMIKVVDPRAYRRHPGVYKEGGYRRGT